MTTINRLITTIGMSAALTALPLTLGAATYNECAGAKPTAASYTWDFQKEANTLFQDIQAEAQQTASHSARLMSFSNDYDLSWQSHSDELSQLKAEVNDIGQKLCRLETIRRVVAPWQQRTIDRIAGNAQLMADNTQDAIVFLNNHRIDLWNPTYQGYADNLYREADQLTKSAGNAVEYAKVLGQYQELRSELGVPNAS